MRSISLEISPSQVEELVERLPLKNKLHLVRKLEKETFAGRLDSVVGKMRRYIRRAKISAEDIEHICEQVKRDYDEKHRSH